MMLHRVFAFLRAALRGKQILFDEKLLNSSSLGTFYILHINGDYATITMDYGLYLKMGWVYQTVDIPDLCPAWQMRFPALCKEKNNQKGPSRRISILKYLQKTAALLLVVLLIAAMAPAVLAADNDNGVVFTEVDETVYATTAVNIRTGPSTTFKKIGMLSYGDPIQRIGIGANGWSKVLYNGETAYMYSDYLSTIRPATGTPGIDYTDLSHQIAIASGLKMGDYTTESWDAMSAALTRAMIILNSDNQVTVDKGCSDLKKAIANLVAVDRSALEESLADAEDFAAEDETIGKWFELLAAVNNGKSLLGSNDQAAIDAATARIDQLLVEVKTIMEDLDTPEIVTQEVQVEVPPTDDYCNIPVHRVWPVLFFCSLALNVALVAVIVIYISGKKKKQTDDTPLVDYDISDDLL